MKIAIMQPTFNPWIGYFDLIDYVDKFIFLDTVQLNQQSWQTRNKIKVQDKELFISVPVQKDKSKSELMIKDTLIDFRKFDFRKKLFRTLEQSYKKSKYFDSVNSFIKEIVLFDTKYLSTYNINMIKRICEKVNLDTEIVVLSQTEYSPNTKKGEQVLDIFNYFKGSIYVSPLGSKEYLDKTLDDLGTTETHVEYQYYSPIDYCQVGSDFIPYMGIFDILYNEGFENFKDIMKSGRKYENR